MVFELTYMFRWLGGNTRIVQIAKASSQSVSGGFRKVKKTIPSAFSGGLVDLGKFKNFNYSEYFSTCAA